MIRLQTTENSQPKFYKVVAPTTEVKVTKLHPLHFYPDVKYNHEIAEDKARRILFWNPFAAYEVVSNEKGRLELWVQCREFQELKTLDDNPAVEQITSKKKIFEATAMYLISDTTYFNKTGNWVFMVEEGSPANTHRKKGILIINFENKNGKKAVQKFISVPVEYSYISSCKTYLECTTFSYAKKYFTYLGQPVSYSTYLNCEREREQEAQEKKAKAAAEQQAAAKQQTSNSNSAVTETSFSDNAQSGTAQPTTQEKPKTAEFKEETYDNIYKKTFKSDDNLFVIKEVAVGKTQTRITAVYENKMDNLCYFFYQPKSEQGMVIVANGKKYYMIAAKGLPYQGEGKYCMKNGETITLTMYFDALPDDVQTFLLQEGNTCAKGSWCVKNVAFKKKKNFFDKLNDAIDEVDKVLK
jgi:hypothetical protein